MRPAVALLLAAAAPGFRYQRPVLVPAPAAPETCVVLDRELLANADLYLRDLRVYGANRETPYLAYISSTLSVDEARPQPILNLGQRDGRTSFDVEMTEPRYSRLLLHLRPSAYSVLVRMWGMERPGQRGVAFPSVALSANAPGEAARDPDENDAQNSDHSSARYTDQATDQVTDQYTDQATDPNPGQPRPRAAVVPVPLSSFRYLHFEVETLALDPVTPADIAGVDVIARRATEAHYATAAIAGAAGQAAGSTVYRFALPQNVATDRLAFAADDPKAVFSRIADVERDAAGSPDASRRGGAPPRQSEGIRLEQDGRGDGIHFIPLALGAVPYPSIVRLTVENGDDAPLALHGIELQMLERRVCLLAKPGVDYVFRYGNPGLAAARYDLAPLEAALPRASLGRLGPEEALEVSPAAAVPWSDRHRALLWASLLAAVAALSYAALRSARR